MANMRENSIEALELLFQQLLHHTRELAQSVVKEEADPDHWNELLEKRELVKEKMEAEMSKGAVFREEWKQQYLQPILQIDQRTIPMMEDRKEQLSEKLNQIQRGKTINQQYRGYSSAAYGAFFDTKK
ncbi:hypothetical protein [Brevibacillus choshinensis]|uniref:Flagellar protein FliT n=1 Tax=Brevibacillus choshinensis TaxID=54911 RepID=A0ABX7FM30_BRECH|nr:hypothetical protein [Brevibacillus choshinensis]QRG67306.1 hypothetical protein JNE38_28330 [Brevibacillus choshinensis]